MPLFKTITEVKKYVSVNAATDLDSLMPDIIDAEEEYIVKYLGQEQYEALVTAYEGDSTNLDIQNLVEKVQKPLINLALANYIILNQVQISETGVHIVTDADNKTAWQWQINDLIDYFLKKGFNGLETLLTYLEAKRSTYTIWSGSTAYTDYKKFFINSAYEFQKHYNIKGSRLTYLSLSSIMKRVEDLHIKPAISPELFAELKTAIKTGDALSEDHAALIELINPAIAYLTIGEACGEMAVEFQMDAFVVIQTKGRQDKTTAPNSLLEVKKEKACKTGGTYLKDLVDYLNKNASETKYITYYNSDSYHAPANGDFGVIKNDDTTRKIYNALG
jgi:hypothetical protein